MIKFLITGYYGFLNSGDDAILTSMCEDVRDLGLNSKITILSNNPQETEKEYKVHATNRFNMIAVIKEIKSADVLLMGGGSLLQDCTSTRSLIYYLAILWLAKAFGKKTMIYANGIGPIRRRVNRWITKYMLNKVDLITLREKLSYKELEKLGVRKPLIKVTADPVFSLKLKPQNLEQIFEQEKIETSKPLVGVLFRPWKNQEEYSTKMALICDYVVRELGMNILFIPMKYPTDLKISNSISEKMECKSYSLNNKYDVNTIIEVIGKTRFVLSMRLHALLYAALKNKPMIGYIYDPKVKYFLEEMNISALEDIESFTVESSIKEIHNILEGYLEIQMEIEKQVDLLKKKAEDNKKYLMQLIQ